VIELPKEIDGDGPGASNLSRRPRESGDP